MKRRPILLGAAVVIAAIGAILVFAFANNAKSAAFDDAAPVKVLVATQDIPAGTSGADVDEFTEVTNLPDASVPDNALSDLTSVENSITAMPIYKGQTLLPEQFSANGNAAPLAIPDGKVAMAVELEAPNRVAGFLTPGADISIYATVKTSDMGGNDKGTVSNLLIPKARVIAVGPETARSSGDDAKTSEDSDVTVAVVTVAVTNEEAKRLALGYSAGDLHFALLDSDSKVSAGATVTGDNFFAIR